MAQINASTPISPQLRRELGTFGAVMMGLGSVVGTGIFVGTGIAAGIAGPSVLLAVVLAAVVAVVNGLAIAQLAAGNPDSGGTYESGYKTLPPMLSYVAGLMFLCAKSASAATAALAFAGYLLTALDLNSQLWRIGLALAVVVLLTGLTLGGVRQSPSGNMLMVAVTVGTLLFFAWDGMDRVVANFDQNFIPFFPPPSAGVNPVRALFHATALIFVAYTGYGRIAAMGEEVRDPARNIPRAIVLTVLAAMVLYLVVTATAVGAVGAEQFAILTTDTSAPLEAISNAVGMPGTGWLLTIGALTALLSVLLYLILGLSRVMLMMGRRHDMPVVVARISKAGRTPEVAVVTVGVLVAALVLIGDVRTTWAFSAFAALIYYAITNLAAYQLPVEKRRYSRWVAGVGLLSCLFLAFWVDPAIWVTGLLLIVVGLGWRWIAARL